MLEKLLLQRMQLLAFRHALDGLDAAPLRLDTEHQARAHQAAVHRYAACTAVARCAAFLAAGQEQYVAQDIEQRLLGRTEKLDLIAVDRRGDVMFSHGVLVRARARW